MRHNRRAEGEAMRSFYLLVFLALGGLALPARGDLVEVFLRDGAVYDGVLIRETRDEVVIRLAHGTLGIGRSDIDRVKNLGPAPAPKASERRLPGWEVVFDRVYRHPEGRSIRQIPATVIDEGVLRHVPYMSHRFGSVELNIYGDPDAPVCIEVGIFRGRPMTPDAKQACFRLMAEILTNAEDRLALGALNLDGRERQSVRGFTFEITPPEAEDAYGGWWVSVYDGAALDGARASDAELREITASNPPVARERDHLAWKAEDHTHARPARSAGASRPDQPAARPATPQPPAPDRGVPGAARSPSGSGTVYVRGYHRKDGTYVRPHTRRR